MRFLIGCLQFIQELFPELQSEEFSIKGLKLPSQPKNSLRLPLGQKKRPTVCGKFNDSLIKLVVAMKRYVYYFFIRSSASVICVFIVQSFLAIDLLYLKVLRVKTDELKYLQLLFPGF